MALAQLLTEPVTILSQTLAGHVDAYGNEMPTETVTQVLGHVNQVSRKEAEGYVPSETFIAFLPATTTIQAGDRVLVANEYYTVSGPPKHVFNPRKRTYSHIECTLARSAGGLEVGS